MTDYSYRRIFYWESDLDNAQDVLTVEYILNQTQPDLEDYRITLNDGETLLPIWNQTTVNMDYCMFWCLFPNANTTYYLYWGNPDAVAVWNQTAVFADVITSVVAAWPMNEANAGDTVEDYSGNSNDGTPTGTYITEGKFAGENARGFNATLANDLITGTITDLNLMTTFSMYLCLKSVDNDAYQRPFYFDNVAEQLTSYITPSMSIYLKGDLGEFVVLNPLPEVYINLIVAVDGGSYNVWINDTLVKSDSGALSFAGTTFWFGVRSALNQWFNGILSGAFITSIGLTQNDANALKDNYPDSTLETGTILVRAWADSSITSWGETEIYVASPEYSSEEILGVTIALIITFFSAALIITLVRRKRNE